MDALAKVSVADALTYVVAPLVALRVLHTLYAFVLRPGKKLRKYGEWAVITGATDGIGKAYAFELAKQGLKIFLVSRSEDKLVQVEQELKAKGFDAAHLAVDFSNFDAKARAAVKAKIGALDVGVLINNVGMSYPFTKFYHELTDEEARPAANAPPPRVRARARALTLSRAPAAGGGPRRDQRELDDVDDAHRPRRDRPRGDVTMSPCDVTT